LNAIRTVGFPLHVTSNILIRMHIFPYKPAAKKPGFLAFFSPYRALKSKKAVFPTVLSGFSYFSPTKLLRFPYYQGT
jgi:hypothetical protein